MKSNNYIVGMGRFSALYTVASTVESRDVIVVLKGHRLPFEIIFLHKLKE